MVDKACSLKTTTHGTCCGASVIDGFYSEEFYVKEYLRQEFDKGEAKSRAAGWVSDDEMFENLRRELTGGLASRKGQITVVLNHWQHLHYDERLQRDFGFQLIYSDVSNANYPNDPDSRLYTYIRANRPFHGDRLGAGLGAPVVPPLPAPLPPPPKPKVSPIPKAGGIAYGRPL